ncbi:GNAT family N-acetyltransferase [Pararhodobacter sp.]|uniref:GNAT family N-acetyltransferase n=1 Tax=Pararhodobacter sp. TaxID=2127056 RepID=UPI002FDEE8F0
MTRPALHPASEADADSLADLRLKAMRPSLEAAGRFDPERARRRFLDSFTAADTQNIRLGSSIAGFLVLRVRADHLYLDHLYIAAPFQRRGIGRQLVEALKEQAGAQGLPLRLTALKGSAANAFYLSCGFRLMSADALDNFYQWQAD